MHKLGFCIFNAVNGDLNVVYFLLVCIFLRDENHIFDIQYSVNEIRPTMGQDGHGHSSVSC